MIKLCISLLTENRNYCRLNVFKKTKKKKPQTPKRKFEIQLKANVKNKITKTQVVLILMQNPSIQSHFILHAGIRILPLPLFQHTHTVRRQSLA